MFSPAVQFTDRYPHPRIYINVSRINLSASSTAQLQHLAETCAPATFGVAGEDVYDETYRKAGKLDNNDFAIGFDARSSSLVDVIRTELLVESPTWVTSENLNIELYKLNVYGAFPNTGLP